MTPFITDHDVLDYISDDLIYLRELVESEKTKGSGHLDALRQAHLGRLVTVFTYNAMESYRDFIARSIGLTQKTIYWENFFTDPLIHPYFLHSLVPSVTQFKTIQEVLDFVLGLKALRDIISHGLTDDTAERFEKKCLEIRKAGLFKNPMKLTINDVDVILKTEKSVTNLIGFAFVLKKNAHNKKD